MYPERCAARQLQCFDSMHGEDRVQPVQPDPLKATRERSGRPAVTVPRTVVAAVAPEDHDDVMRVAWVRASTNGMGLVVCAVVEDAKDVGSAMESLQRRAQALLPQEAVPEIDVSVGDRAEQILGCANRRHAALLVIGPASHHEGLLARFFNPSVPTELVRAAEFPILVTRYSPPTGRIVAAVELGETTFRPVLEAAASELRRAGGKLHILHCVAPIPVATSMEFPMPTPEAEIADAAKVELEKAVASAGLSGASVQVEMGPAGQTILDVAKDLAADLIVVGTHGRHGAARVLLGSIAEEVLRGAACNVMIVRAGA
jgi:universal stress protein A